MAERPSIDADHPWPWLDPFSESASSFFNGRDDDAQALLRGTLASPVCVLFGKSGLGKTSLLLAGLFPLLRARTLLPVALRRIEHGAGAPSLSAQLLRVLGEAVQKAGLHWAQPAAPSEADADDPAALWELLHDRRRPLLDAEGGRWTPVFVLDQFEEIFTLQPDEQLRRQAFQELGDLLENRVPPAVAARLEAHDELIDAIDQDSQPYRFLVALREDYLPELETWADLIPRLGLNRYRLLPMSREQALDAVLKTGGRLVDGDTAQRIVDFLGRQASPARAAGAPGTARVPRDVRRIEPALLSLVCASLNADRLALNPAGSRLDAADIEARGAQILDRFYDDAFAALPDTQREAAGQWVEANLITEGGTRRPYPLVDIDDTLRASVRQLVDRRLLRIENTEQGDQVELVHDRLAAVARQRADATQQRAEAADRLRRANEAAQAELIEQRARAVELAEEAVRLKDERAEEALAASRRVRRLAAALAVLAAAAILAMWWALNERQRTADALLAQQAATEQAQRQAVVAERSAAAAISAQLAASQALAAAELLQSNQPAERSQASALLAGASTAYQTAARDTSAALSCPSGRRIYPQVGGAGDVAAVDPAAAVLRAAGFTVPRTDVVGRERMPSTTEVRYFRKAEEAGALAATAALSSGGMPNVPARYVRGYEDSTTVRPCHYELWLVVDGKP